MADDTSVSLYLFRKMMDAESAEHRDVWYHLCVADANVGDLVYGVVDDYVKHGNCSRIEMLISVLEAMQLRAQKSQDPPK